MVARHLILPVLAVCLAQGTCTALNMYINTFIASYLLSLGVDPREVSTYVGVIEGLEALTEVSMIHFHVLAIEWIPHRWLSFLTIIIPGSIAGLFGLATSPWQLAVMRCLMGVFGLGGMQAIILGEITDSESSSQAFGWLTIAGSIGVMSGAGLSGYLAEPAGRVPIFGDIELFKQKPYLLPGLTIALVALLAALAVFFTVPETNAVHQFETGDDDSGSVKVKLSYRRLASSSLFRSFLSVNFFHKMTFFGCMALLSSAGKLSPDLGGIGMTLPQIGRILAITPIPIMLFILLFSTKVTKRFSTRQIVITSALGGILAALYFPLANYWVIHTTRPLIYVDLLWYTSQILGRIWWTMQMIIMLKLYPQAHHRGRATLVAKQSTNLANAIGAPLYGRIFGFSSHYDAGSLGRQTIWIFGGFIAIMAIVASVMLPEITKPDPITEVDEQLDDEERQRLLDNRH